MRSCGFVLILVSLLAGTANATERYTEAKITQIEPGDNQILLFLQVVSGDAPPNGNGASNEPFNKPYLFLANSASDIASRAHFLATALLAHSQQSVVRIRWEDAGVNANRVMVLLLRQ